ncbi:hypothetical protein L484_000703 [Morus notabilis]|uniref:Uncharacterized protein n=1 Tax=Morus notabilis TaxID=981085 RepID=W9QXG3_9ROSA|nr:hypothetical protein L484_000703 [Morus notabilis]
MFLLRPTLRKGRPGEGRPGKARVGHPERAAVDVGVGSVVIYDKLLMKPREEAESSRAKSNVYSTFITSTYGGALVPVILLCQVPFQAYYITDAGELASMVGIRKSLVSHHFSEVPCFKQEMKALSL